MDIPLVVLGHRRNQYLGTCLRSLETNLHGAGVTAVVDDSGKRGQGRIPWWQGVVPGHIPLMVPHSEYPVGYRRAMETVFSIARSACALSGSEYALLWEEDFELIEPLDIRDMVKIMDANPRLAQLNLQRQAVYAIERRLGYMRSHATRGYQLHRAETEGLPWVRRKRPFTTNPSLIRREVLDMPWPTEAEASRVRGGAEPAMSLKLERAGWTFGWLGVPDHPQTKHLGDEMKTGSGY